MKDSVWIVCYECDGVGYGWERNESTNYLPMQCDCSVCNGEKKVQVDKEFAKHMGGIIDNGNQSSELESSRG